MYDGQIKRMNGEEIADFRTKLIDIVEEQKPMTVRSVYYQMEVRNPGSELAFEKKDGCITYFNGHMPVFTHGEKDVATFRMITSQFCVSGYAKQSDIIRAFGVTSISVKRSVKLYREKGTRGFYAPRVTRGAAVLVDSVVAQIEELLAAGASEAEVAKKLELKRARSRAPHASRD